MDFAAFEPAADIDRAIRRVVVGYRGVAAVWLAMLGVVALAGGRAPSRPGVVAATMVLALGFATVTVAVHLRSPDMLRSGWWLILDVGMGVWTLLAPDAAGSANFYGGYPMSPVFVAAYAYGVAGGLGSSIILAAIQVARLAGSGFDDLTASSAAVLIYLFAGAVSGWAVGVLRRADRIRRRAEEALSVAHAEWARAEERAEMAAHLHDSVLQTLALIQRVPDRSDEVATLARRQERELRDWLYGAANEGEAASLMGRLRQLCAEIEELHRVPIDVVTVGDGPADERATTLLRAAREALVNAAEHSGADRVSVYAEAGDAGSVVFVRDRGSGFDPGSVEADRRGVRDSIVGRMDRAGGFATVRTAPGEGTEVELRIS